MGSGNSAPEQTGVQEDKVHSRILCYGDSLTAGYYARGKGFSPYSEALKEALAYSGFDCDISTCGLSGHLATEMVAEANAPVTKPDICGKVGKGLARMLDEDGPFDLVILMAGTNDLSNSDISLVLKAVCKLHSMCHARDIPTIVMAAPFGAQRVRTSFTNALQQCSNKADKVLAFVEPEKLVPRSVKKYWDPDAIHFSPTGCRALGHGLAPIVAGALEDLGHSPYYDSRVAFTAEAPAVAEAAPLSARSAQVPPRSGAFMVTPRSGGFMPVAMVPIACR